MLLLSNFRRECKTLKLHYALKECGESGEGASINANRILRNWGAIWTDGRRPEVRIAPPISKNEVRIIDVPEPDSSHLHCYW